jgi:hypothetical protein
MSKEIDSKGFRFYFSEAIGSLVLIALLGIPLWIPLAIIIVDLNSVNNSLVLWARGESVHSQAVLSELVHYMVMLIPTAIILYWYKSSDDEEKLTKIDLTVISQRSEESDSNHEGISWKAIGIMGNPHNNKEWITVKSGIKTFKGTYKYQIFTYPLVLGGMIYAVIQGYEDGFYNLIFNYGSLTLIIALFLNSLFYLMSISHLSLNLNKNYINISAEQIAISDASLIQVIHQQKAHTSGGDLYDLYEVNLVFSENKRSNFLNHGDLAKTFEQISQLNEFLNIDVVVDSVTYKHIKDNNKEVELQF